MERLFKPMRRTVEANEPEIFQLLSRCEAHLISSGSMLFWLIKS
jgi:hypothetical protein